MSRARTKVTLVVEHPAEVLSPRDLMDAVCAYVADWDDFEVVDSAVTHRVAKTDASSPSRTSTEQPERPTLDCKEGSG